MENSLRPQENIESQEKHEFSLEEIVNLLTKIDSKEHPSLSLVESQRNINGELMNMTFSENEKEVVDGVEREVSYLVTVAGQRYKKDGTPGAMISKTFLTKDYDEGMGGSEQLADFVDNEWTNLSSADSQ